MSGDNLDKGPKPKDGKFLQFDHITFYVGNAKQAASYYVTRLGFEEIAYQGLETGHRKYAKHLVRSDKINLVFVSAYEPNDQEIGNFICQQGDAVKDIAFEVENLNGIVEIAKDRGAIVIRDIWEESDENGSVRFATLKTYGNITHTLVERKNYTGTFLPGYQSPIENDALAETLPPTHLNSIDHCVSHQPENELVNMADWYMRALQFHRFWSFDDEQISTEYSAMNFITVVDYNEKVMMPLAEPAFGKKKSQIQEFLDYNGGPGIQHIAMRTDDIIAAVKSLQVRGMNFLKIPDTYYDLLHKRLAASKVHVKEDFEVLKKMQILIDFDDNGYLLQIFTKNLQDKPTVFMEIIQRFNFNGFGAGNFKTLFEAIEIDQNNRGNL